MNAITDDIIREGSAIARELERGQADCPLVAWFEDVRREPPQIPRKKWLRQTTQFQRIRPSE